MSFEVDAGVRQINHNPRKGIREPAGYAIIESTNSLKGRVSPPFEPRLLRLALPEHVVRENIGYLGLLLKLQEGRTEGSTLDPYIDDPRLFCRPLSSSKSANEAWIVGLRRFYGMTPGDENALEWDARLEKEVGEAITNGLFDGEPVDIFIESEPIPCDYLEMAFKITSNGKLPTILLPRDLPVEKRNAIRQLPFSEGLSVAYDKYTVAKAEVGLVPDGLWDFDYGRTVRVHSSRLTVARVTQIPSPSLLFPRPHDIGQARIAALAVYEEYMQAANEQGLFPQLLAGHDSEAGTSWNPYIKDDETALLRLIVTNNSGENVYDSDFSLYDGDLEANVTIVSPDFDPHARKSHSELVI